MTTQQHLHIGLNFTVEDLQLNQEGHISPNQQREILRANRTVIGFAIGFILLSPAGFLLDFNLMEALLIVGLLGFTGMYLLWITFEAIRAIQDATVESEISTVTVKLVTRYGYQVQLENGMKFPATRNIATALQPNKKYKLYYIPERKILSAEILKE